MDKENVKKVLDLLEGEYPEAECALHHRNPFELIVAVALSAQTTDKSVNQVTPGLFEKYPDAEALSKANPADVENFIRRIGMYKTKSKNIVAMAQKLVSDFGGRVPDDYDALVSLPGVGRKTANVVLSVGFGHQRIAVDTPEERWSKTHHSLIFHGRNCCTARKPDCENCVIADLCEKNL